MAHVMRREEKPTMPGILKENDLLERAMAPKEGEGKIFLGFKKELVENLQVNAGCMAFARKMCDDSEFYKFVEKTMLEREKRGYKYITKSDVYNFVETEIFNLRSILAEISGKEAFRYDNLPSRVPNRRIGYEDLEKLTETDYEVKQEYSALNTLFEKCPEEFGRRLTLLTLHDYVSDHKAAKFMISLLRIIQEKHLYEGEFKFADIGTASGEFSDEFISFIRERFSRCHIVRTNPAEFKIGHHKDLPVRIHDISREPLGEEFNLILIKDVMKFFERGEARGRVWENVMQSASEGSIVISGGQGEFRSHVLCNGKLVRVAPEEFLIEMRKVGKYQEYLSNLSKIVERSSYDHVLGIYY